MKYQIETLLAEIEKGKNIEYLFFWGHQKSKDGTITASCFSQWWEETFVVNDIAYKTAEHFMMAGKALLFKDKAMFDEIIEAETPNQAKKLGRKVKNFDDLVWKEHKTKIVIEGNFHKFSQHTHLKNFLLSTGNKVIVEASPYDRIWGIGMGKENADAHSPQLWKGLNLLGFALMEVRERLTS
jgi:ribA/ribD-fused uncharacterized protein